MARAHDRSLALGHLPDNPRTPRRLVGQILPDLPGRHVTGPTDAGSLECLLRRRFAVLITVLVLDLRPPDVPTFWGLLMRWPVWLSYAVSYVFIAIVWVNHHYLMRFATGVTPRLMWFNFAHLFSVSLLPLSTAWMAVSELAPQPVAFYAGVFFLVNLNYVLLIRELIDRAAAHRVAASMRRSMHIRSMATLILFAAAALVALTHPILGLSTCCGCLIAYLRPDAPEFGS